MNRNLFLLYLIIALALVACPDKEEGCDDCGGTILDGYYFDEVTTEDIAELGEIEGIEIGACIRYKLDLGGTNFNIESVKVVDDCCCVE